MHIYSNLLKSVATNFPNSFEKNESKVLEKSWETFSNLENQRKVYKSNNRQNRYHFLKNEKFKNVQKIIPLIFEFFSKSITLLESINVKGHNFDNDELILISTITHVEKDRVKWNNDVINEIKNLSRQINRPISTSARRELAFNQACLLTQFASLNHGLRSLENNSIIFNQAALVLLSYSIGVLKYLSFDGEISIQSLTRDQHLVSRIDIDYERLCTEINEDALTRAIDKTDVHKRLMIAKCLRTLAKAIRLQESPIHLKSYQKFLQVADYTIRSIPIDESKDLDVQFRELSKIRFKEAKRLPGIKLPKASLPIDEPFKISTVNLRAKKAKLKKIFDSEIAMLDKDSISVFNYFYDYLLIKCGVIIQKEEWHPYHRIAIRLHNFYRGLISVDEVGISDDYGMDYLRGIKLFDWAIAAMGQLGHNLTYTRSSHELRHRVLELCPHVKFPTALMRSLIPGKLVDGREMLKPYNWVNKQAAIMGKILVNQVIHAMNLDKRITNKYPRRLTIGMRGNTASGKSTTIHHLLKLMLNEPELLDALEKGIINIDYLKKILREEGKYLTSQVHSQASEFLPLLMNALKGKVKNVIHDARLLEPESIDEFLNSVESGHEVWIVDLHVSLATSLFRLLARSHSDGESLPYLDKVVDGYIQSIKYRRQIINSLLVNQKITEYLLLKGTETTIVAQKVCQTLVKTGSYFDKYVTVPSKAKVQEKLDRIITNDLIIRAIAKGIIPADKIDRLTRWIGYSLQQAVFKHVTEVNPKGESQVVISLEEADAQDWLENYPELQHHIDTERKLHIRGTDNFWEGWHFPANHFKWNLNPKYHPENAGEMSLGYFAIPYDDLLMYGIKSWDAHIVRELMMYNINDKNTEENTEDLRFHPFFVHPESYDYFANLFEGNFRFVRPNESKFVGIPTSSYRSWLVRSWYEHSTPFIVKFGVMGPQDTSKMISETDLKEIAQNQIVFSELSKNSKFTYFPENVGCVVKGYGTFACMMIREIPKDLLYDKIKIINFSSLMSMERSQPQNKGVGSIIEGMESLPLIFEVMANAIEKNEVKNPVEFVRKFLIHDVLDAIEEVHMKKGKSFSPHPQNLCIVLKDGLPSGVAYRDFEGIFKQGEKYLETYSWFYRYYVFTKILNVLLEDSEKYFSLPGAPIQKDKPFIHLERALYSELKTHHKLSINKQEYLALLKELDQAYLYRLGKYFDLTKVKDLVVDGFIPSAEPGSVGSENLSRLNQELWKARLL